MRSQKVTVTGYGSSFAECVADADMGARAFFSSAGFERVNVAPATVHEEHHLQSAKLGYVVTRRTFAVTVDYRGL